MSDNIHIVPDGSAQPPKKKARRWPLILAALLVTFALIAGFILLSDNIAFDGLKRSLRYLGKTPGQYGHIALDGVENAAYAAVDGTLVLSDGTALRFFAEDGNLKARIGLSLSQPMLHASNKRVLCLDIGSKRAGVYDENGAELFSAETDGALLCGDLSSGGYCALLSTGQDVHGTLEVYHPGGSLLYRYRSSADYLNTCAVSPDGKTAVAVALGQKDVHFSSTALLLRTDSEDAPIELSLGEQVIYALTYLDAQTLCAIGEKSVILFTMQGDVLGEYTAPEGAALRGWCAAGDGVLLALDSFDTADRYRAVLLDRSANTVASVSLDGAPLSLSAAGNYLAVLTGTSLTVYDASLALRSACETGGKYAFAAVRRDGTALAAGSSEADLIFP